MRPFKILLVEDNEGDIFLTAEAFENILLSNVLNVVRDGKEALDFLQNEGSYVSALKPDMILLDINLPKINGHEVLSFIKGSVSLKHIPVIMLTTSNSQHDINLAYENYANCYIVKPDGENTFDNIANYIEKFWMSLVSLSTKPEGLN